MALRPTKLPPGRLSNWNEFSFILDYDYDPSINITEIKGFWSRVINSAVNDYIYFKHSSKPYCRALYHMAKDFLFDDRYTIMFGDAPATLQDLLDHLDLDIVAFRESVIKREAKANVEKELKAGTQLDLF